MMIFRSLLIALVLFTVTSCRQSQHSDALSLLYIKRIYVLIEPSSVESLNNQLKPSLENYGEVTSSKFVPTFDFSSVTIDFKEDLALTAYTSEEIIPKGKMFMPMTVRQLYETALGQRSGFGAPLLVNPNSSGKRYVISREEIKEALPHFPVQDPLPLEIGLRR